MSQVSAFPTPVRDALPDLSPTEVQKQTILNYLNAFDLASQLTEPEKLQFIEIAQAFKLNPFKREIHVARMRVYMMLTAPSTRALSRGECGRAGKMTVPW